MCNFKQLFPFFLFNDWVLETQLRIEFLTQNNGVWNRLHKTLFIIICGWDFFRKENNLRWWEGFISTLEGSVSLNITDFIAAVIFDSESVYCLKKKYYITKRETLLSKSKYIMQNCDKSA